MTRASAPDGKGSKASTNGSAGGRGRLRRRVLIGGGLLVVLLIIVVVMAPFILSRGPARAWAERAVASEFPRAQVSVERVRLSWFGGQSIGGVELRSDELQTRVSADASLDRTLLGLIFSGGDYGTLTLHGEARTVRFEDGSIGIARMLELDADSQRERRERRERERVRPEPETTEPPDIRIRVLIGGIDIEVEDRMLAQTVAMRHLRGEVLVNPTERSTWRLDAQTSVSNARGLVEGAAAPSPDSPGRFSVNGSMARLFGPDGAFDPMNSEFEIDARIEQVPSVLLDALSGLEQRLTATLGPAVELLTFNAQGSIDGAAGSIQVRSEGLRGEGAFRIADRRLIVDESESVNFEVRAGDEVLAAWLDDEHLFALGMDARPRIVSDGERAAHVRLAIRSVSLLLPTELGVDLRGGSVHAVLDADPMVLEVFGIEGVRRVAVGRFDVQLTTDDLTGPLNIIAHMQAAVDERPEGDAEVALEMNGVFAPDGRMTLDPDRFTGTVDLRSFPAGLAQPMLAQTPFVVTRDIGDTLDLRASFAGAEVGAGGGTTKRIAADATAENLRAEFEAEVDDEGAVRNGRLALRTSPHPDLIAAFYEQEIFLPADLRIEIDDIYVPATGAGGARPLGEVVARGRAVFEGEMIAVNGHLLSAHGSQNPPPSGRESSAETDSREPLSIASLEIGFSCEPLYEGVAIRATGVVNGSDLDADAGLENLINDSTGAFEPANLTPRGVLTLRNVERPMLAAVVPGLTDAGVALLRGPATVVFTAEPVQTAPDFDLNLRITSDVADGTLITIRRGSELHLQGGAVSVRQVDGAVVRDLMQADEAPFGFASDEFTLEFRPGILARFGEATEGAGELEMVDGPTVRGQLRTENASVFDVAGLVHPLMLRRLAADVTVRFGEQASYSIAGRVGLRGGEREAVLSNVNFDLAAHREDDETYRTRADLTLAELRMTNIDPLFGATEPVYSRWVGDVGTLRLLVEPTETGLLARLEPDFPYLKDPIALETFEDRVEVSTPEGQLTMILTAAAQESWLNRPVDPESPSAAPRARFLAADAVPVTLAVQRMVLPLTMFGDEPIPENAPFVMNVEVAAGAPIRLLREIPGVDPVDAVLRNVRMTLQASDFSRVDLAMGAVLRTREGPAEGDGAERSRMELTGSLRNLLDDERRLATAQATLDAEILIEEFPTWVLDAVARTESLLSDALGESISAEGRARGFSSDTGRLNASITSENESTANLRLAGRGGGYVTQRDTPIDAALTLSQDLRDRLLYRIHPIFRDVRSADQQVRITINNMFVPADWDLSRLDADIVVRVGDITLDAGSQLIAVMQLAAGPARPTIAGHIGDLNVRIRNGIVKYDNFVVSIDRRPDEQEYRHRLVFSGEIDLPRSRVVSVVGAYPLADLRHVFRELAVLPGVMSIGMKFSGPLFDELGRPRELRMEPVVGAGAGEGAEDAARELLQRFLRGGFGR